MSDGISLCLFIEEICVCYDRRVSGGRHVYLSE